MSEMSPLARVLLDILHKGTWFAGGLLLLFAGILLGQRWTSTGFAFEPGDIGFLITLVVLFALAVYIARGIRKEMDTPGSR
jgi:hypothetical protein